MEQGNAMMEKNPGKWIYLPAVMAALLLLAAIVVAGVAVQAGTQTVSVQTPVDTTWEGWPEVPKVYNFAKAGATGRSVPMVELDTNTYEKRLWLSERVKVSSPTTLGGRPQIIASDSVAVICYRYYTTTISAWLIFSAHSFDFGRTWTDPVTLQSTGYSGSRTSMDILGGQILLAYSASFSYEESFTEILFRAADMGVLEFGDSTIVDTAFGSSEYVMKPRLAVRHDTIYVAYAYRHDDVRSIVFKFSVDGGDSWMPTNGSVTPTTGTTVSLLAADSALAIVNEPGLEVWAFRSLDGGQSWDTGTWLSPDIAPSQNPAAASNGLSDFHAVWYDFDGAPPGWGGFVFYTQSWNGGGNWSEVRSLSADPYAEYVDIHATGDKVYAVWANGSSQSPNLAVNFRYSLDRGESWSPEIVIPGTDLAVDPQVFSQDDLVHFTWSGPDSVNQVYAAYHMLGVWYLPGDVDLSEGIDIADLVYMVDWMFSGGPAPVAYDAAQMDGLGEVDISDLVYIVDYMFNDGPPPVGGAGL
jgi:hypothetical protein